MTGTVPTPILQKLIVLMAFDRGDDGELRPAFEPRQMPSEERAIRSAKELGTYHAGVVAWTRSAKPDAGEFGEPVVIYTHGDVPEMDLTH